MEFSSKGVILCHVKLISIFPLLFQFICRNCIYEKWKINVLMYSVSHNLVNVLHLTWIVVISEELPQRIWGIKKKGRGVRKISACGVFLKGDGILHDELGGGFFAWWNYTCNRSILWFNFTRINKIIIVIINIIINKINIITHHCSDSFRWIIISVQVKSEV